VSTSDHQQLSSILLQCLQLYNSGCTHLTKLSRSRSLVLDSLFNVATCLKSRVERGLCVYPVNSSPWIHIKTLVSMCVSGIFVLHNNTEVLDKDFWLNVEKCLSGGCSVDTLPKPVLDSLQNLRLQDFCVVCDKHLGHRDVPTVLDRYCKVDEVVDFLLPVLDRFYFALVRLLGKQG